MQKNVQGLDVTLGVLRGWGDDTMGSYSNLLYEVSCDLDSEVPVRHTWKRYTH